MESPETEQSNVEERLNISGELTDEQETPEEPEESVPVVDEETKEKLLKLPLGRVKIIAKTDPDVNLINQEAMFLITKSTELFIDSIAKEAYKYTVQARKKTVQKKDLQQAIDNIDALAFLEGMLEQWT
ncbi:DNA polymerase epsilon subunit 4 [Microplitis demolitor]|uniref:DNA polymerase epsilon subunit 4 n=1 Tax=Microplitis demolitor TaxID=69319 RepID=UPI0004CD901A|nr:DNA polymerase epsilon subunit 4 [Microplitis demolitor]XP_014300658.1 DNA polymerase epsilon subunit 4 [Microplitis demolitor]XP_014300661.1 DNA polymerase epsilon subunit 4 [Microplitis demolitor]XP_053595429.1 DNA polymerase epsilon subunit 4 [Microplitis demolitor]